ncbi:Alkaline-phosphatase-like, core domain [Pseudocohnilembus persalinus]|uniref:Alkaline-phosphatase-like, core domain n=1 Tax=Pseudocohnilembus persalinus TaxID=266149 RepID=A0A0V0QMB3_PSEPJ|nr:Alkaline-phosphatase-like, core domain [Pseudocohnilembus persalinus]|eukprot:KRX03475.1 Alkaline-phosphatase-like, core domain [Pseudocohnilembus persalinus]
MKYFIIQIITLFAIFNFSEQVFQQNDLIQENDKQNQHNQQKKVLLLGLDGLDYRQLSNGITNGELIGLSQFTYQKSYCGGEIGTPTEQPVKSGPSWMTILTGNWMNQHHVSTNLSGPTQETKSIYRYIKQANPGSNLAIVSHWSVIENKLLRNDRQDIDIIQQILSDENDNNIYEKWLRTLKNGIPDFTFFHFNDIDHSAHLQGFGETVNTKIINADKVIQKIMLKIKELISQNQNLDFLVMLVSDHGRDKYGWTHGNTIKQYYSEKLTWIGTNQPQIFNDEFFLPSTAPIQKLNSIYNFPPITNIVPTILNYLEIDYKKENINGISMIGDIGQ